VIFPVVDRGWFFKNGLVDVYGFLSFSLLPAQSRILRKNFSVLLPAVQK